MYKKIDDDDRKLIEKYYNSGCPIRRVAEKIGACPHTMYLEIPRGYTGETNDMGKPEYSAETAARRYQENIHRRGRKRKND